MALLLKKKIHRHPIPGRKVPPKRAVNLFYLHREDLNRRAYRLPREFSDEVDTLYSNSRKMVRMLKEQGITVRSSEDAVGSFGIPALVELEKGGETFENRDEAAKALGKEFLCKPSAPEELNRSAVRQLQRIKEHETLGFPEAVVYGYFLTDLVLAHNFTLSNAIKFKAQKELSEKCGELDSISHETSLHNFWEELKLVGAAATLTSGAMILINGGNPLRELLLFGAVVLAGSLATGLLIMGTAVHAGRRMFRTQWRELSRNLEALDERHNEAALIVRSMNSLQQNLFLAIEELGRRSKDESS